MPATKRGWTFGTTPPQKPMPPTTAPCPSGIVVGMGVRRGGMDRGVGLGGLPAHPVTSRPASVAAALEARTRRGHRSGGIRNPSHMREG